MFHRDIPRLDPAMAWAERELLRPRLAHLTYNQVDGELITRDDDGELLYEAQWIRERLARLAASLSLHGRRVA